MRKKFLLMTFLTLLFTAMGTSLLRAENGNVAKVGNTEYATIDEAIANWTNNTTLTLLADVTLSDVVTLKSTEHHTLDLGTHTMTAASGKHAIEITCEGRTSASYAITVKADETNPGGITATGKSCIYYYKSNSTKDRPIIRIYNGVFNGSYSINSRSNGNTNCPQIWIYGGTFNGNVSLTKNMLRVFGGVFNGWINCTGDSSAYREISGGTFKSWQFMTADADNKFWVGTSKATYDVGMYVNDEGYLVVGGGVVTEPNTDSDLGVVHEASTANYGGWSSYLKYSSAKDNGLYYTSVEEALADNNKTTGSVTVYVDELDMTGISYKGTIVVPADHAITITNAPATLVVKDEEGNVLEPKNGSYTYTTIVPKGNDFTGYTRTDAIWGEVWGNAYESFVIKVLDANGNVMGTTSLNNIGGIIDGDVTVTWSLKLDAESNTDEYWTMSWTTAPSIGNMPAKVELWVDGVKVSGGDVVLNGPDEINKIYAAVTDEAGKIYSYHKSIADAITAINNTRSVTPPNVIALLCDTNEEVTLPAGITLNLNGHDAPNVSVPVAKIGETPYYTLAEAVAAAQDGEEIEIIKEGDYTLPEFAGKELTFKGSSRTGTSITDWVNKSSQGMMGSTVHFENLTISGKTENYYGLFHTNAVTYKDCNINGLRFLYSPTTFEGCAFNANGVEHSFWTYGASNVTVTGCTFTYTDRAVNCYSENGANHELDITFTGCTFTYAGTNATPEGAVEINSGSVKSIDLVMNGCTAPANGAMWFNSQWDSKHGTNTVVYVDGVMVWTAPAKIGETRYATLQEAVDAAQDGEEIDLLKDVELTSTLLLTKNNILDGNGFMLTPAEGFTYDGNNAVIVLAANMSGYEANRTYTVKNLTIKGFSTPSRIVRANFCDATIQNCLFDNNTSESIITSAYAVLNVEDNNIFTNNTASFAVINVGSDVSDGTNLVAKIIDNTFENNQAAIAGIFLASSADVTDNHFKNNTHTGDNANAAAILAGPYTGNMAYTVNINRNAFENAMSKGGTALPSVFAEDWSSLGSTTSFDLSLNYWDGNEPVAGTAYKTSGDNPQVTVKSYYTTYTDGTLGGLIEYPQGNNFTGYTGVDAIWGEVWGNASESFVIKVLNANGNVMGTTSLNNIGGIIDGDVNVTWNLKLDAESNTDEYWTMSWTTAPSIGNMPAKVELWVDGVKVSGGNVVLNGPDEIDMIYAAVTDEAGKIYSYHKSIADAITAINNTRSVTPNVIALLRDTNEEVTLPAGITLNLNGHDAPNVSVPVAQIGETPYYTLAEAVAAVQEGETIQLLNGEIKEGTIKLPATLKNVTFKGAANHASVLKDMTIMAADGNSFNYEGLTFDGIYFYNSRISLTGWRNGDETIEDLTITNCIVENLYDDTNLAFLHINKDASEPAKNLTFTNNVLNGVTGGSKSGIYSVNTGDVIIKGNTFNNIVFRPALVQLSDCDDIVDNVEISNNVISNTTRLQVYGTEVDNGDGTYTPTGTDELEVKINNNIFKNISGYYICTWGINGDYDISKNYYDSDNLSEKIYWNNEKPSTVSGLYELGVYPVYTELNADGTINTESEYTPNIPFAQIGETGYPSLEAAAAAAQAGDEILLLVNVTLSEVLTTPPGITLNGNGKQINGSIVAGGDLTIKGHTKATSFNAGYNQPNITIGAGACLEITGTGRMVIGHGATFSITGTITDAKNANVADLTPSLIMPGASFTGAGVTFNVTNAYISAPSSYCSSSSSASGTFDFNITNSIWESAGKLAFESQSTAATVNFELKDSKLTTGSHLVFGVSRGEVVFDNSNVNVGTSRQIENQSTMTVKNGSVVKGAVATSSNAKNPGTLIVDNATYAVTGEFSGSDLGTGTIVYKNGATISAGSITKANIQIDATGMSAGDEVNITANLANLAGTIEVINTNMLDAKIVDGKIVIVERTLQGEGTADNPYLINDISDLVFFRDHVNAGNTYEGKYIKVTAAEIDLNNEEWTPIAYMGKTFKGNFDGNNVTVKNLKITKALTNSAENNGIGFFGRTDDPATIENIIIENVDITGSLYVGAIVGYGYTGKHVKGCTVKGNIAIDAWWYAGVIGGNGYMNLIDNCHVIGNDGSYIKGNGGSYIGGIWGFRGEGNNKITNCTVENLDIIGVDRVGGICGIGHYGNTISGCDAEDVTVTATDPEATTIGLLVGATQGNNISGQGPTIFEDNDASGITAQIDNGDGTYTEVTNLYGTNIDGSVAVTNYVAQIVGGTQYATLAEAVAAAVNNDVITLLPTPTDAPIAMAATIVNNKTVTITGTADVDWDKGWLYVGRNGEGNGKLIFREANLTSKSVGVNGNGIGLNVSCKKEGQSTTNDGEVEIIDSNIQLDYLIGKGNIKLDNSTLNVYEGFAVGARPASETGGVQRTVTMDITNGSKVIVKNHNGQGLGYESKGIMNIDATSTFETTQSFLITADGTMNVNGGNVKTVGTLTNNGTINVTGESTLNIEKLEGSSIDLNEGAIVKNSTVGGDAYIAGNVIFRGDNTFNMITDYGDYYSQVTPSMWTVEAGASLTLTKTDRYGLGYGDKVTVYGELEDGEALTARASLTDEDASVNMYGGLVGMTNSAAPNAENSFTATDAYLIFGVNGDKSFGNKSGNYYGNYTFTFNNSVVTANGFKFYEDNGTSTVKFSYSDLLVNGVLMTNDASSSFTFENSVVLSKAENNGTDDKNQNAGVMTLTNTQFTYSAAFTNVGNLNIGEYSTFTAPSVVNNGAINFTALSAKLVTLTEGLTIVDQVNNADYKVVYKEGAYQFVQKAYVAQIDNGDKFETLKEAVDAVEDGGTITLIANETFTENNRYDNGGWWDGLGYSGDKSFTIDLGGFTIGQDGALNDYLMWFKNDGAKDNTITLKNGTLDAGTTAYSALATASSNAQKITVNLENIEVINNNSNGATLKIRAGAELNVKAGTVITGKDSYLGIECWAATVNIYDGAKINMNGTSSYCGCLAGASGNGTINVYGGEGQSKSGGFIAMTSGGTINIEGGEWIANNDGTYANSNKSVLVAQSDKQYNAGAGNSIVNVTGGTFKGGYNCYGNAVGDAQINISGGNFNADPSAYVVANYKAVLKDDTTYDVIQIAGTQTFNMEDAGWYWFSTYIKFDTEGEGLDALKYELDDDASLIKGQYAFTNYLTYNNTSFWTSGNNALTTLSPSQMYMINTTSDNVEVDLTGAFLDYEVVPVTINVKEGWNWIGYPVSEEVNINNAIPNAKQDDVIKSQFDGYAMYYKDYPLNNTTLTGWYGELTTLKPGRGYMYQASEDGEFSYTKGNGNGAKSNTIDYNGKNYWFADATQYPNNMSIVAMLSIDGEIVKGNYEVAAFANGECRGSARPIYIEAIDTYVLYMTIYGDEVEELTFMYYDIDTDTEYELNNVMNYSNDAIVGTLSDPYIFSMNILGIGENSIDNINIYPNPTTTDREINLQATCDKVEVFNALGVKVAEYHNVDTLDALETAGIYVIRITNDNAVKHCRLVVK